MNGAMSFRLRRHSLAPFLDSRRCARSAYGATRSAPLVSLVSRRSLVAPTAPLATPLGHLS